MRHPHPAEHDQQQAEALDMLRGAESFALLTFSDEGKNECMNPLCDAMHFHRCAKLITSCTPKDLRLAMESIGEEIMYSHAIEVLMNLEPAQREQVAEMLRHGGGAYRRDEG